MRHVGGLLNYLITFFCMFAGTLAAGWHPVLMQTHLLKTARPQIESDVNSVHADVSFSLLNRQCPGGDVDWR